ncbi:MAG: PAS domain-containing protein [Acidobacteria bacterium]|nr:PAS domain-containing protein [Acidobacteriota bacterium]
MRELKNQLVGALLVVLTAAAVISAVINFQQQLVYQLPEDGAVWADRVESNQPVVTALHVEPDSGAALAGLRAGDQVVKINNFPIASSTDVSRVLARIGPWKDAEYVVRRQGFEFKSKVIVRERAIERTLLYQYGIGLVYLAIGLFVYLRRSRAAHSIHFYILCLASFVLLTFHYTGKLNNFDKVTYWGNVIAGLYAPTIFLHFCLAFPESASRWVRGKRTVLLYLPATFFMLAWFGFASGALRMTTPLTELRWLLDRAWLIFLSGLYLAGCAVTWLRSRHYPESGVIRQQLKWLRNGALAGVLPFTLFYTLPYAMGFTPNWAMNLTVLALALVPLTWAYAILRHRLMDVDLIFQQGSTYTLATLGVMGLFYSLVLAKGSLEEMNPGTLALLMMAATFLFQPLRNWIEEVMGRHVFYKDRYDYRRTLLEFARELGSETNLDHMLGAVADRLRATLSIKQVGFFLAAETGGYELTQFHGGDLQLAHGEPLDLSFLKSGAGGVVFFERTRSPFEALGASGQTDSARATIGRLDLTYYIPCEVRGRTIAYLGGSRTVDGSFLSSEDVELVTTLAGYVGIAMENALLYRSLKQKAEEYERLKEFSENIVESINVGIVAADLDDRVESWNSQIESLTGIPREIATGRRLEELFPHAVVESLDEARQAAGVHQVYKVPLPRRAWSAAAAGVAAHTAASGNGTSVMAMNGHRTPPCLVNLAIAPLVTREQEQIGRLIIFDDVTERAELEQRLVQKDKLSSIGLLAAGVAHEVNTPLAVISSYAQMLTKQIAGDDPKSKLLEKIAKQTFRASEIVNSLLNFSRTSETEFEELDLNRAIRETLSLIEHQLEKSRVQVEFSPEAGLPPIKGNHGKLQQVFLNLFLNARDAMEAGGVLRIATSSSGEDGRARITVSDTGKGIAPEDLARIYDPFFTTKGAKKGTGLGLAVSYGIVREHGGKIEADSRPSEGTTFKLDFPLVRKLVNA